MKKIAKAIQIIEEEVVNSKSRCVISSSEGNVSESSILGTRDGYINLALSILLFIQAYDDKIIEYDPELKAFWDDKIKQTFLQLPNNDPWIVGTYIFDNLNEMMNALEELTKWDGTTAQSFKNDPDFCAEQSLPADARTSRG